MTALLKKRALAEYCSNTIQEETARPIKKLQIVKRSKSSDHWDFDLSTFESGVSPSITLQSVLSLHQLLPLSPDVRSSVLKKLLEFLHIIGNETEVQDSSSGTSMKPILISKLFSLLPKLISISDYQAVLDKIISITQNNESNTVISHGIHAVFNIFNEFNLGPKHLDQIINLALSHLKTTTHYLVKVRCLEALGAMGASTKEAIETVILHVSDQDNRVRTAAYTALLQLQKNGATLPAALYDKAVIALDDDYRCVRESALNLIVAISGSAPDRLTRVQGSDHHLRLADHAFSHICNAVNDVSVRVRTLAVTLLGEMQSVSEPFLRQTLDKKLMSNMRRKSSAHERARVMAGAGEWASGRRWAEDVPLEQVDANAVQVINGGACGAFVHGLEDEFLEVRTATLDAIRRLAADNAPFANRCLDFMVDMFNDEIEDVRLKAIHVLCDIAHHIRLRPDQLDEILHALKDSWLDIRESLHAMLALCRLGSTTCVSATVTALLDNLCRYPQDKRSIHRCLKQLGAKHPELVLALVPQLLLIHPYLDGVEPSVEDPEYICRLILVFNAAAHCPTMLPLLEQHTLRHYVFLRDSMPQLVPTLRFHADDAMVVDQRVKTNTANFLQESLEKVGRLERSSTQLRLTIYAAVHADLSRLAEIDPSLSPAATMAALHIDCMRLFTKVLSTRNWLTPSSLSVQQSGALKISVDQLLRHTLQLRYAFSGLSAAEEAALRCLRVRALALQLVYVVHGSTGSALGLCNRFLEHTDALHRFLLRQDLTPDSFLEAAVSELSQLEEPRPGAVARILQPLLLTHYPASLIPLVTPTQLRMTWAEILEPAADSETVYKLGAGLVAGVALDAELWHVTDLSCLRVRVTYPDHSSHLTIPMASELRPVVNAESRSSDGDTSTTENEGSGCVRLLTTVLISAQAWSEACQVGISLVLDMSQQEALGGLGGRRHAAPRGADDGATTVALCQPVKVLVWPKQSRKGI